MARQAVDGILERIPWESFLPTSLTIVLSSTNAVISWPSNATGFTLQETATLSSAITWTDVTNSVVVSGTNNTVTVNASSGNNFFRLKNS